MRVRFRFLPPAALAAVFFAGLTQPIATAAEAPMTQHAHGTFTVKMGAPTPGPAEGLSTLTMEKHLEGSFEGSAHGEMIAGGNYQTGAAGYVAIEVLTGKLNGKTGSFALQHTATMKGKALDMNIIVTPGSGTGELRGIDGTFNIIVQNGQHAYSLDYTLPASI